MKKDILYRFLDIDPSSVKEGARTVELSFSSEEPYERYFGVEILDHGEGSVNLSRMNSGAALLLEHDTSKQIGVVENARIDERRGKALVRFSRSQLGEEVYQDVLDGIRRNVSVGYRVHDMQRDGADDAEVYRVGSWEPLEISIVSVPADASVGVGRMMERNFDINEFNEVKMEDEVKTVNENELRSKIEKEFQEKLAAEKAKIVDFEVEKKEARKQEQLRVREILEIGKRLGYSDEAQKAVSDGVSLDDFRAEILVKLGDIEPIDPAGNELGMSEKDVGEYSIVRAIRGLVQGNMEKHAPYEKKLSDEVAEKIGREARGFFIPDDVLRKSIARRDLVVGTTTSGGHTVATDLLASSFIELLRNKMVTRMLGATVLTGLKGNVAIPSQTGGATAYWIAETSGLTESQQTFGQVTMSPNTVGAYTEISRKLLIQSSLDIEAFVRNDLAKVLALEIDRAAINGSGSGAEPTGILKTSGIGNVGTSPSAPTYANIIELWTDVASENADVGALAFLTSPGVCAKLMQTFTNTTYGEIPIWMGGPGDGSMLGYKAVVSNQVPSTLGSSTAATTAASDLHALLFGNWNDLLIGEWSGLDVLIDPYTKSHTGTVRVVTMMDVDIAVRHAESFSAMQEVAV